MIKDPIPLLNALEDAIEMLREQAQGVQDLWNEFQNRRLQGEFDFSPKKELEDSSTLVTLPRTRGDKLQ